MPVSLPAPIDLALMNQRIQEWADALVASYAKRYPEDDAETLAKRYGITVDPLRKYWRVVMTTSGDAASVHAFVDPTTGDVLKAAGWKSPAKGVRYNLLDDDSFAKMLANVDPFGSYLYVR
jgi:hypothetical protein